MRIGECNRRAQRIDGARRGARTRRLVSPLVVLALALSLLGVSAAAAQAEGASFEATFTCTSVTYTFTGFPNATNNTVHETVYLEGKVIAGETFHFNGPSGSNTIAITVPPGHHGIDARATWNTNGVKGGGDFPRKGGITCEAEPRFSIEKLQKIAGSKSPYTTSTLTGKVGQTVDYAIEVTNTGNVPLTFSNFTDPKCDAGTISGGPGAGAVAPGAATIYTCDHVLTAADDVAGFYTNSATVTGTPTEGEPTPITHESNTVIVELTTKGGRTTEYTCNSVTFLFEGFPNLPNNTVTENVYIDGKRVVHTTFTFNGPSGTNTIKITVPPGHHNVDGEAKWNTNGFKGGFDNHAKGGVTCAAEPGFSIVKYQTDEQHPGYTTQPIPGEVGKEVDYIIEVTNTGNVPLKFSNFTDEKCGSAVAGGPGEGAVAPGETTYYACDKILSPKDGEAGFYSNSATDTGTPTEGPPTPITHESNTVVVTPIT